MRVVRWRACTPSLLCRPRVSHRKRRKERAHVRVKRWPCLPSTLDLCLLGQPSLLLLGTVCVGNLVCVCKTCLPIQIRTLSEVVSQGHSRKPTEAISGSAWSTEGSSRTARETLLKNTSKQTKKTKKKERRNLSESVVQEPGRKGGALSVLNMQQPWWPAIAVCAGADSEGEREGGAGT